MAVVGFKKTDFMDLNFGNKLNKTFSGLFKQKYPLSLVQMLTQGKIAACKFHISALTFAGVRKYIMILPAICISMLGARFSGENKYIRMGRACGNS